MGCFPHPNPPEVVGEAPRPRGGGPSGPVASAPARSVGVNKGTPPSPPGAEPEKTPGVSCVSDCVCDCGSDCVRSVAGAVHGRLAACVASAEDGAATTTTGAFGATAANPIAPKPAAGAVGAFGAPAATTAFGAPAAANRLANTDLRAR